MLAVFGSLSHGALRVLLGLLSMFPKNDDLDLQSAGFVRFTHDHFDNPILTISLCCGDAESRSQEQIA